MVPMTVLLAKKPAYLVVGDGPSVPREKLKASKSACCSIWGSINTHQGVSGVPEKVVGKAPLGNVFQILPGTIEL
jgi:hypothetical protein